MTILPKGHGPMLVRNHLRDKAIGGLFTGRYEDIAAATGVPEKSVEKIMYGLRDKAAIQIVRPGSPAHPARYWVEGLGFERPAVVESVPAPVRQSAPFKPPAAPPAPVVMPFGFGPMPRADNPVRLVPPGTYPAGRFAIGARR